MAGLALLWGSSFLWIDLALASFDPVVITWLRLLLGTAVLLLVVRGQLAAVVRRRGLWPHVLVAAVLANVVPFTLFALAQQEIASNVAGALNATTPIWSLLLALASRTQERTSLMQVLGLALGLAGTLVILRPWDAGGVHLGGALLALVAAASYGAGYVYVAARLTPSALPPTSLAASQLLTATAVMTVLTPAMSPLLDDPAGRVGLTPVAALAVGMLGVGGTGLAYVLLYRIITDDGPVAASAVTYLLPVVALTLGALVLDDPLTLPLLAGAATVLLGVALTRHTPRTRTPAAGREPDETETATP